MTGSTTRFVDAVLAHLRGDGVDDGGVRQHAGLDGVGADVGEHGVDLRGDELGRHGEPAGDFARVLRGDGGDGGCAVDAERGEGLEVGLDAGAAAGVAAGDREGAGGGR